MNHWFIGDGVCVRYESDVTDFHPDDRRIVRVTPEWQQSLPRQPRQYHVVLTTAGHRELRREHRDNLIDALKLGEEWLS